MFRTSAFVALAFAGCQPVAAASVNDQVNAVYASLETARQANSVQAILKAFGENVLVVDERSPQASDHAGLEQQLTSVTERLAKDGGKIRSAYRIVRRTRSANVVVDAGLMKMSMDIPGQPARDMYRRFLVTLEQQGPQWRIVADSSTASDAAAWNAAMPVEGLKYDR